MTDNKDQLDAPQQLDKALENEERMKRTYQGLAPLLNLLLLLLLLL